LRQIPPRQATPWAVLQQGRMIEQGFPSSTHIGGGVPELQRPSLPQIPLQQAWQLVGELAPAVQPDGQVEPSLRQQNPERQLPAPAQQDMPSLQALPSVWHVGGGAQRPLRQRRLPQHWQSSLQLACWTAQQTATELPAVPHRRVPFWASTRPQAIELLLLQQTSSALQATLRPTHGRGIFVQTPSPSGSS
jgi:hypothetical protein